MIFISCIYNNYQAMLYRFFSSSLPRSHFSEKKNFFSSITSTIKGFLNPNTIQEHNPKLTVE